MNEDAKRRLEIYADLVGQDEIARDLNVTRRRVRRWIDERATTGSPAPVRVLGLGRLYSLAEWRAWFALWKMTRMSANKRQIQPYRERGCGPSTSG